MAERFYALLEQNADGTLPVNAILSKVEFTGGNGWTLETNQADNEVVDASGMTLQPIITGLTGDGGLDGYLKGSLLQRSLIAAAIGAPSASTTLAAWSTSVQSVAISALTAATVGSDATLSFPVLDGVDTALADLKVGQFIRIRDTGNEYMDQVYRVKSFDFAGDPHVIVVEGTVVDFTGTAVLDLSSMVRNGTQKYLFTAFDVRLEDDPTKTAVQAFYDQVVDSYSISIEAQSIVTCSYGFIGGGSGHRYSNTDVVSAGNKLNKDGTDLTAATYAEIEDIPVMNSALRTEIRENDVSVTVQSATFGLTSGRGRAQTAVGSLFNTGVELNKVTSEMSATVYYAGYDSIAKLMNVINNDINYAKTAVMTDSAGNCFAITFPRVFVTGTPVNAIANDTDYTSDLTGVPNRYVDSEGVSYQVQVDFFPAPV